MFQHAHNFEVHQPTFIDNSSRVEIRVDPGVHGKAGIRELLNSSMRDAFHDSSARWPPPRCHYGTRQEHITSITQWGLGASDHTHSMLWMYGPFGVGKTAIAQSCAEALAAQGRLGASLFFSRPNSRNKPDRVFTSLAYQIAIKCPSISDILDREIQTNPALLTASLPVRFQELLAKPLRRVPSQRAGIEGWIILIDGLDECDGAEAQRDIIHIIANSVRERSTPFRWFITSRPEPHIVGTMNTNAISPWVSRIDLPLSPKDDHDILIFLMEELEKIGERHGLQMPWPSEGEVAILVELTAGLWIYAATVVRFIGITHSLGPVDQLRLVLSLGNNVRPRPSSINPLAQMDFFYDLFMQQLPSNIASTIRKILLLNKLYRNAATVNHLLELANILALSERQIQTACGLLGSVLYLRQSNDEMQPGTIISFYHASFMEFMEDAERSTKFCIYGDSLEQLQKEIIERINEVHSRSTEKSLVVDVTFPRSPPHKDDNMLVYCSSVKSLLRLCDRDRCTLTASVAFALVNFQFPMVRRLFEGSLIFEHERLRNNLPPEFRKKLLRRTWNPLHYLYKPKGVPFDRPFILGHGKNQIVCWCYHKNDKRFLTLVEPRSD